MSLDNYREISSKGFGLDAGFQFEFFCHHCGRTWRGPFVPYRAGQFSTLLSRFSWMLGPLRQHMRLVGDATSAGARGARESALESSRRLAAANFRVCGSCDRPMCSSCLGEGEPRCIGCVERDIAEGRPPGPKRRAEGPGSSGTAAPVAQPGPHCPACQSVCDGGRFCPECGFDLASSFKSCPSCAAQLPRQARYCGDCGHSF